MSRVEKTQLSNYAVFLVLGFLIGLGLVAQMKDYPTTPDEWTCTPESTYTTDFLKDGWRFCKLSGDEHR